MKFVGWPATHNRTRGGATTLVLSGVENYSGWPATHNWTRGGATTLVPSGVENYSFLL